ncbi:MAG: flagellar filament capping protein FliD [Lachnospiraceae bacterium]|nr:flagellar filament capping protein FliD [Lachnospiraceae bacterium]
MANNAVLSSVYNQYLTTYAPQKSNSRFDAHKRSELKNVYNSMLKVNRDAPLYKIDNSAESREFIIGLKEGSRVLHNNIVSVIGDVQNAKLNGRIAYSTDESIATAEYIGNNDETDAEEQYEIEVRSLATPQVNLGLYLPKEERDISTGKYAFDVVVGSQAYEFQYTIKEEETNFDIQNKLSRLINNAGIRLSSSVEEDENGYTALRIESSQKGSSADEVAGAFTITDSKDRKVFGSVPYLGIDYVAREATSAEIVVNGQETESSSNVFLMNKKYRITLNGISPAEGVTTRVGVKPDTEAVVENISNLVGSYNNFIKSMNAYSSGLNKNETLFMEMNNIIKPYSNEMAKVGISISEGGTLDMDVDSLTKAINESADPESVDALNSFTSSILKKSNDISLDPVAYINKKVVAYKNPGKNFTSPYTASAYSGLLFNSYC